MDKTKKWLGALSFAAACFTSSALISSAYAGSKHTSAKNTVETQFGTIEGLASKSGSQFLGIPYAKAPVGDLRWRAPQPIDALPEGFTATDFGPSCAQAPSPFGEPSLSEDCLYLNIYRPRGAFPAGRKVPVMVWIHGGAFTYGTGKIYDPTPLTKKGVMVVTINYRVGALGFMAHPALSAEAGSSGNYGIQDQQMALQWVQDNIADFGGNPDNVTLFGQSAGGLSVHAHLASPGSTRLFDKAIIQSGAYLLEQPDIANWEYVGLGVAAAAGCPDQSPACLRSLPVEAILANQDPGALGWLPIVDGNTLPLSVAAALFTGNFNQVSVMEGTTADEYTLFTALSYDLTGNPITNDTYLSAITDLGFPAEVAPLIASYYPPYLYDSPGAAFSDLGTDMLFACNGQTSLQLLSQHVTTYGYEFNDPNAPFTTLPPVSFPYKATHGAEIPYLMNTVGGGEFNKDQKKLSRQMIRFWTNFAKTGNPNGRHTLWDEYNPVSPTMLSLQPPRAVPIQSFNEDHNCDFWNFLFSQQ